LKAVLGGTIMTLEGARTKVQNFMRPNLAIYYRHKLQSKNFSIISNNCWAGKVYEVYGLQKQSPTIGMFIMPEDYIEFVSNLKTYLLESKLYFIKPSSSKWLDYVSLDKRFETYPVGLLKGKNKEIEIFFLHYKNMNEVKDKWKRRIERVNWDKILVKFSDQNNCAEEHIKKFCDTEYKHKVCFTVNQHPDNPTIVPIKVPRRYNYVPSSYEPCGRKYGILSLLKDL
jgi:uncharacterized protein (DUF1919 family)